MDFYLVRIHAVPELKFACTVVTDRFKNVITHRKDMLELSLLSGGMTVEENGAVWESLPNSVCVMLPDRALRLRAAAPGDIYITTAAVKGGFSFRRVSCEREEVAQHLANAAADELALPLCMPLDRGDYNELEMLLRRVSMLFPREDAAGRLLAFGAWCEALALADRLFRADVAGDEGVHLSLYYSQKAKKYIQQHYAEPITVRHVAEMLNVTPNYLSSLFRRETGQKLSEYLAKIRVENARKLLYDGTLTAEEVARRVGVGGAAYLNRLFIKHYGINMRRCVLADHELTLYHEKPWEHGVSERDLWREN